jgi:hypothetical protein
MDLNYYWMKGIEIGYLKSSPLAALTLAIITQITLSTTRKIIIGIPMIMIQRGAASTIYNNKES